jgi:hypothetical protein
MVRISKSHRQRNRVQAFKSCWFYAALVTIAGITGTFTMNLGVSKYCTTVTEKEESLIFPLLAVLLDLTRSFSCIIIISLMDNRNPTGTTWNSLW